MWSRFILIFVLFFIEKQSLTSAEDINLHVCMKNKTISVNVKSSENDNALCQCQTKLSNDLYTRDDYVITPGVGVHKIHKEAKPWNEARKICKQEGGYLAIINSKAEETALLNILNRETGDFKKDQIYIGIHDMFKEGEWITIFDEPLESTGYSYWSSGYWGDLFVQQPDNAGNNQNCGALILQGGLDDENCDKPFPFFCELLFNCE